MSTTAMIWVKIPKRLRGKEIKCDATMLKQPLNVKDGCLPPTIKLDGEYVGVYHNWDGYTDGLGSELFESYNSFEKALNLISCGSFSTIIGEIIPHYSSGMLTEWDDCEPIFVNSREEMIEHEENYNYLFQNGKWLVSKHIENGFKFLENELKKLEK